MSVTISNVTNHQGKKAITEDELCSKYVLTLGTPFPAGKKVNVEGRWFTIERYEFKNGELFAVSDSGKRYRDYDQLASDIRRGDIQNFYSELLGRI